MCYGCNIFAKKLTKIGHLGANGRSGEFNEYAYVGGIERKMAASFSIVQFYFFDHDLIGGT